MPLLANLDLSGVPDDPRAADGDYVAEVIDAEIRAYDVVHPDHPGAIGHNLIFTYEIIEGRHEGIIVLSRPQPCNPWDSAMRRAYLKRWMINHGVAPEEVESVEAEDLIGRVVNARVRGGVVVSVRLRTQEPHRTAPSGAR